MCKKVLTRYSINVILISTSNIIPSYLKFSYNFILVVRLLKRSESEFIMTTKKSVKVDGEFLTSLFETKANEILAKESKKKATKKVATEKAEVKDEKPKTKKTVKASKKADTEKVVKDEKITKKPAKKVAKKAEKPAKEQAEKPKKATKKAEKVEKVEQEQELRKISKSLKVAKTTYKVVEDIKSYEELLKAVEEGREIAVAFDCSEVAKKDYEEIFHVPYVNMKDNFDICEPIFIGEKVPRLVFASIYSEALWDLFTTEFDLISAVLEK